MTREIMSTCRNQEDIDDWFSEVTEDTQKITKGSRVGSNITDRGAPTAKGGDSTVFSGDFDSAVWDDFSVSPLIEINSIEKALCANDALWRHVISITLP